MNWIKKVKSVHDFSRAAAVLFLCALLQCLALPADRAGANELEGFRGLRWGTTVEALGYTNLIDEIDGIKYYRKMNDEMHLGTAGVKDIAYAFSSKGLVGVLVNSKGVENARLILETLKRAYSEPAKRNDNNYYWSFWGEASIYYNYNPSSRNLFVSYVAPEGAGRVRFPRQR
ncbi:MAG: hypothetical protein LBS93_03375 [Synergistaceae bacterium]|nr:hypothetical protein [Synergistaceae bacterium]